MLIDHEYLNEPHGEEEIKVAKKIKKRRRNMILMLILFMPVGISIMYLLCDSAITEILLFSYIIMMILYSLYYGLSKCPRCNNYFSSKWWYGNNLTKECLHCGLSIRDV